MKASKMLFAVLLALTAAPDDAAKKPLIAVLEFRTKLDASEKADADPAYFSDVVRSQALDELPAARIMTRENMTVLIEASGKNLADCEGECDVDTGRNLGADDVITGELLKVGTNFKLDLKLHATADGRLLAGAQASGKTVDELDAAMPAAVTKLLSPLKTPPQAQTQPKTPPARITAAETPAAVAAADARAPIAAAEAPAQQPLPNHHLAYRNIRVVDGRIIHVAPFFNVGEQTVKKEAQPMLHEIASALLGPPALESLIVCRADIDTGPARRNALQRAWALRHALVEQGVAPTAIQARGTDVAGQLLLVKQVKNPYSCEIVLH